MTDGPPQASPEEPDSEAAAYEPPSAQDVSADEPTLAPDVASAP